MSSITTNKEPYSKLLTSTTCKDKAGKDINCDSGAPYNAGVLTTRSFLLSHAGPFNISRAAFLLRTFSCSSYPIVEKLEPPLKQEQLIEPFSLTNGQGFGADSGNGTNCLSCHSQFGKHTQFFVKFDRNGLYVADADGLQDQTPNAGSGYTSKLTYVSHLKDQGDAGSEASEYFGKPAKNLQEAARAIVQNDVFIDCSIRKVLGHYLRMQDSAVSDISPKIITAIRNEIKAESKDPTFQTIVTRTLSNEHIMNSFIKLKE